MAGNTAALSRWRKQDESVMCKSDDKLAFVESLGAADYWMHWNATGG